MKKPNLAKVRGGKPRVFTDSRVASKMVTRFCVSWGKRKKRGKMKNKLLSATGGLLLGGVLFCSNSYGLITGSKHDFSQEGWSGGEICVACHAPHNNIDVADAPLWNHTVSEAVYELYTSPTLTADDLTQPGGVSKLCLSCHDGTVAVDAFGGSEGTHTIGEGFNLGTDLGDDHPISFTYDSELALEDGGLHDPASAVSGLGGTIEADMLFAGRMECASCHDVHNKYDLQGLLKVANDGSALCLTCHDK